MGNSNSNPEKSLASRAGNNQSKQVPEQAHLQADILARLNDAVIAVDNEERIKYWNRNAEKMYGIAVTEASHSGLLLLREDTFDKIMSER